jgi:hypothetical protein
MDIRYQPGQPLQITVLDSRELLQGHIVQIVGRAATFSLHRPLAFGAPIRIDFDDCMLLGEVAACEVTTEDYVITLDVVDAIPVMSDLARLVSAVMTGGRGAAPDARTPAVQAVRH